MSATTVVTELQVLERLRPVTEMAAATWSAMPFLPKDVPKSNSVLDPTKSSRTIKSRLSRSTSLDRIRQFPAYLCTRGCLPQALSFLRNSAEAAQASLTVVRRYLLVVTVYLCLFLLTLQLSACACALLIGATPPGLVFLVTSSMAMCAMACRTILHDPAANPRPNTKTHNE
ncbi:uncharacterized protein [Periplaneta americana]